jgi:hypothetical protein
LDHHAAVSPALASLRPQARIGASRPPLRGGEILASSTIRDLVVGSDIAMTDRGTHPLEGVDGTWQLFAASP